MSRGRTQEQIAVTSLAWSAIDERTRALLRPLIEAGVLVTHREEAGGSVIVEFAAKFIVPESDTVTQFVRGNQKFLAWRQKLNARASLWEYAGRPVELLLSKEDTLMAQPFVGESGRQLTELELAYLDASLKNQGGFRTGIPQAQAPQVLEKPFTWKPEAPAGPRPAPSGTGEFTRMFQSPSPPAPPAPPASGEFTRTFQLPAQPAPPAPAPLGSTPAPAPASQTFGISRTGTGTGVVLTPADRAEPPTPPTTPHRSETQLTAVRASRARPRWLIGVAALGILLLVFYMVYVRAGSTRAKPSLVAQVDLAIKKGDYAQAIALLSADIDKGKPGYERRAYLYRLSGNLDAAAADYEHAIASGKADDGTRADAAYVEALRGKYDRAIALLTDAIHGNPSKSRYYVDRANAYMSSNQWKSALGDFENALRLDPTSPAAQNGRANALRQLNLPVSSNDVGPRVYIQISSEVQRARARALQDAMTDLGYHVPGIEIVGQKSPSRNELRYVYAEDQAQAERLAVDLQKSDLNVVVTQIAGGKSAERPRHFELWFAKINTSDSNARE